MSILLDALKKSETQRQLGKTPTIHTAVEDSSAQDETEHQWIPLSMLALSAVAIAWFGWQQFREPVDTLDEAGVDIVEIAQVEESTVAENQPAAQQVDGGGKNVTAPASLWNTNKGLTGLTILPAGSPEEARERKEKLSQSFNSYQVDKDTASDNAAESTPKTVVKTSPGPDTAPPGMIRARTAKKTAPEKEPLETPARRASRLQPHEAEPISFWQIPRELRDGLPEFRINVLVYAEKPEDRFILINGLRLVEKEELIDGVVLEEIQRNGAVFLYRNYRFLVKG